MPGNDIAGLTDKITWSAERFKAGVTSEQEFRANVASLLNALETDELRKAGYRESDLRSKMRDKIDALKQRIEDQKEVLWRYREIFSGINAAGLRKLRESAGLSLDDIAAETHLNISTISRVESGDISKPESKIKVHTGIRRAIGKRMLALNDLLTLPELPE